MMSDSYPPAPGGITEPEKDENGEAVITEDMVEYGSMITENPQTPAYELSGIPPEGATN